MWQAIPGRRYRMPVTFGPVTGPRQDLDGGRYDYADSPRTSVTARFLTEAAALEPLLPPGFTLHGEPVVTVDVTELRELEWLAGRSYSMLGVTFPVRWRGAREEAVGPFLAVLWENRPEPILTGREELGFAKIYAEIPPPRLLHGARHHAARWDGHEFFRLRLTDIRDAPAPAPPPPSDGLMHYRYLPRLGPEGGAEIAEAVISPAAGPALTIERRQSATAELAFLPSTWEQLPTMHHIVNALAALPVVEMRGAEIIEARGGRDLADQRRLG